jgi:hypothetical protein
MNNYTNQYVALYNRYHQRFVQMGDNGSVGILDDSNANPSNLESWRSWERFQIIDVGGGHIALHSPVHKRFVRVTHHGEVDGHGGVREASAGLPSDWACERFTLVDAGNGKYAFHNTQYNRFIRLYGGRVDTGGGVRNVDSLPPENE